MNNSKKFAEFIESTFSKPLTDNIIQLDEANDIEKSSPAIIYRSMINTLKNIKSHNFSINKDIFNNSPFIVASSPNDINLWYPSSKSTFHKEVFEQHQSLIFLINCSSKVDSLKNSFQLEWINDVKMQCYNLFILLDNNSEESIILPYFYHDLINADWITEAIKLLERNRGVDIMFEKLITDLTLLIHGQGILSRHLHGMLDKYILLIVNEKVQRFIVQLPQWMPEFITEDDGHEFQARSHLGQLLGLSLFLDDITLSNKARLDLQYIDENNYRDHMNILPLFWHKLFIIFFEFIRKTPQKSFDFLFKSIQLNMKRSTMRYQEKLLCGEGFINNVNAVLQLLVGKIHLSNVDMEHLSRNILSESLMNFGKLLKDETRIAATTAELIKHSESLNTFNGIINHDSFSFYLTMVSHNLSLVSSINKQTKRKRILSQLEEKKRAIETFQDTQNNPQALLNLNEINNKIKAHRSALLCCNIYLESPNYEESALKYYSIVCDFILNPKHNLMYLPEFLFENISEILNLVIQNNIDLLSLYKKVFDLSFYVINNSDLFKSPYLVSKFVHILSNFIHTVTNKKLNNLHLLLSNESIASGEFISSLIKYFVNVEKTGESREFFVKFSIRRNILDILKMLWIDFKIPNTMLKTDKEVMTRFINLSCNDITRLTDDVFSCLRKIKENTEIIKHNNSLSEIHKNALIQKMIKYENSLPFYLKIIYLYLSVLVSISVICKDLFLVEEIIPKITSMLNHFLQDMLGRKSGDIEIESPIKYSWKPKVLMEFFFILYTNLLSDEFIDAISKEERYFSTEEFEYILNRLICNSDVSEYYSKRFRYIKYQVIKLRKMNSNMEVLYKDIPEEYVDPIMSTIMTDPVMLPISRVIMDRSVIRRHLLNDPCDPFNRLPLKYEDLQPELKLKEEIENWILKHI